MANYAAMIHDKLNDMELEAMADSRRNSDVKETLISESEEKI